MTVKALLFAASVVSVAYAMPAGATVAWDGTGATDSVSMAQFGSNPTSFPSGTGFVSGGGITGVVTSSTGFDLRRLEQGSTWSGNFAPGAPVLWNLDSGADIIFTFNTAVRGVGAQFQPDFYNNFTARITLNDGSFFDVNGVSTDSGDNSAPFIGAQNAVADITSIAFHVQDPSSNFFAVGDLRLLTDDSPGAVPEPSTWTMMILGFGAIGGAMRRRRLTTVRFAF